MFASEQGIGYVFGGDPVTYVDTLTLARIEAHRPVPWMTAREYIQRLRSKYP
jgi:hypothetical protein